jgi:hypothetical protein
MQETGPEPDEFNECLKAARYIIKRRGIIDQNSRCTYVEGDLKFERTNTNDIEVTVKGKVALFVPPVGSSKRVSWEPGDWMQEVYEIKEKIEDLESEEEQERISRAEEYCEGYRLGVYEGRDPTASENDAPGDNPSYRAGFGAGLAAARRAKYGQSITERNVNEVISYAVSRLEGDFEEQSQTFTDEQSQEWKSHQAAIKARGERDWQRILLELHLLLSRYNELSILTDEESVAVALVQTGVVRRLARTKIVLPKVG